MSFDKLLAKVEQAEDALEARERQVAADLRVLGTAWRETLTPTRIVIAGVIAGFLAGRARPVHAGAAIGGLGGARWLQLASSVAGLVGALQAKFAAEGAESAAKGAEAEVAAATEATVGAADAASAPTLSPSERRYSADPAWDVPPVAAEAATELSERR
ncbi:hypothetical protein [Luteimonas sp. MC1572]|uniref:hypothetical protein n=1 Tax=Luteimonas sp. MC1572 TaxID=2799325 RepID=UPI0018F0D5E8|nr:hypothetical protein [Luteimonas sp. MC1572]MBJ6981584.1 hypothetical protein [Luteimonas sp. MC1572]QQO02882.1 hypothetical protein JGR64_12065 [Luteimonas sp. MC1572]